eukprot:7445953-Heterocapsa_arctica.AAC.1
MTNTFCKEIANSRLAIMLIDGYGCGLYSSKEISAYRRGPIPTLNSLDANCNHLWLRIRELHPWRHPTSKVPSELGEGTMMAHCPRDLAAGPTNIALPRGAAQKSLPPEQ